MSTAPPLTATVFATYVGQPRRIAETRRGPVDSAIGKTRVDAPTIALGKINLAGDRQADLEVHGRFLQLAPTRATIVGVPAPLARVLRGYLPLPPLPRGARITDVRPGDGELAVTFELAEVDEPLTPDIARRVRSLTRLPIPGLG